MADNKSENKKQKMNFLEPLLNIPKSFKNIKHIVKDPIRNMAEADARKQEVFSFLYLGIILAVVVVILSMIEATSGIAGILTILPVALLLFSAFLLWVISSAKKKFANLECPNCKKLADQNTKWSFEVLNRQLTFADKGRTTDNGKRIQIEATENVKVRISFVCSECGTTKSFEHSFRTMTCRKGGITAGHAVTPLRDVAILEEACKRDIQKLYDEGFTIGEVHPLKSSEVPKAPNEKYEIIVVYNRTPESLVQGYFGNELN